MANIYESFLNRPDASALAPNASLHYITSTTSINESTAIIKHLQAQEKLIKKKSETVINTVSSGNAIVLETETTLEFVRGGGAILPNMDDNMLVDSIVTVPFIHIVQLDSSGKISQIRLHWDQSTMLKQVDAIGRTGRNWPIRDGQAMAKVIKSSVSAAENGTGKQDSYEAPASVKPDEVVVTSRPQSSRSREDKDFHTRLFATGGDDERMPSNGNSDPALAVRTSAKPAPREWDELFAGDAAHKKSSSGKVEGTNLKAGAGTNFGQNRLFDKNTPADHSPSSGRKADPSKYNHFEFGNGEEAAPRDGNRPPSANAKKHMTNWDFEDFSTPPKFKAKPLKEHERHFGPGIDEDEPPSPAKRPVVHAPRPDADPHFAMTDAPFPVATRQPKPARPDALASHLKSENGVLTAEEPSKKPLGSNTNSSNIRRGPDINSHYTSTDASPGVSNDENARRDDTRQAGRNAKSQGRAQNDQHFSLEDTPEKHKQIYKTAGDGMGGRKETSRSWMIGEEEAEPVKQAKIYKTYGNGMGGRRDAAPSWSWGDRDEEVEAETSNHNMPPLLEKRMSSPRKRPRMVSDDAASVTAIAEQRDGFGMGVEKSKLKTHVQEDKELRNVKNKTSHFDLDEDSF